MLMILSPFCVLAGPGEPWCPISCLPFQITQDPSEQSVTFYVFSPSRLPPQKHNSGVILSCLSNCLNISVSFYLGSHPPQLGPPKCPGCVASTFVGSSLSPPGTLFTSLLASQTSRQLSFS